jgi:hypothetical protein
MADGMNVGYVVGVQQLTWIWNRFKARNIPTIVTHQTGIQRVGRSPAVFLVTNPVPLSNRRPQMFKV